MKALNEEQVKVIKDFEEFKESLINKYSIIRLGMSIIQKEFEDVMKEWKFDNKSLAYRMISTIINNLKYNDHFSVSEENMLTEGIITQSVIEDKETAIDICTNFILKISIHLAELDKYLDQKDCKNLDIDMDIDNCKRHIDKVIKVICDIS